ncbi:hypothetical protein [Halomonas sp. HG01]|uniref:hypothetical protein n=1 Tax=Halomonas sp. HG01 TaxID=1609967 RepID=UPI00128CCB1F|nr:hypothetical protein [Halomonas sp. HG01]
MLHVKNASDVIQRSAGVCPKKEVLSMAQSGATSAVVTAARELDGAQEGPRLLALTPMEDAWSSEMVLPGVVTERQEVSVSPGGWQYLLRCLDPVPPGWPRSRPHKAPLVVKRLVMAVGMRPPARVAQKGWLLLSCPQERERIAELVLTPDGRHFLNHALHTRREKLAHDFSAELRGLLSQAGVSSPEVLFGPEALMQVYGLRKARYVDVLTKATVSLTGGPLRVIASDEFEHFCADRTRLLEDARHRVVLDGLKFVSFGTARAFKRHRGSWRDRNDLSMMQALERRHRWRLRLASLVGRMLP